jgi:uncharacterized protein
MKMPRLILIIAIVAAIYLMIRSYRKKARPDRQVTSEDMVKCKYCGVHLPGSESIRADDNIFCCTEHRDAYSK